MLKKRIAVIPAYEPVPEMPEILKEAKAAGLCLLVVDDGSGEAYRKIFQEAEKYAKVLSYPENKGKGGALKTAFSWLLRNEPGSYPVIQMDSDGQHSVADALRLLDKVEEEKDALWLGSRVLPKDAPLRSRIGNDINRFLFSRISRTKVYDAQTGMRAFYSELLPLMAEAPGDRYEYEMNVLLAAAKKKIPIKEMEIKTIYIDKNASSHFRPLRDSVRIYWQILKSAGTFRRAHNADNNTSAE